MQKRKFFSPEHSVKHRSKKWRKEDQNHHHWKISRPPVSHQIGWSTKAESISFRQKEIEMKLQLKYGPMYWRKERTVKLETWLWNEGNFPSPCFWSKQSRQIYAKLLTLLNSEATFKWHFIRIWYFECNFRFLEYWSVYEPHRTQTQVLKQKKKHQLPVLKHKMKKFQPLSEQKPNLWRFQETKCATRTFNISFILFMN